MRPSWDLPQRGKHVPVDSVKEEATATEVEPRPSEQAPQSPAGAAPAQPFVEDGRADQVLDFVIDVLAAMGMDCTVDLLENDPEDPPEEIRLEVEGKDAGRGSTAIWLKMPGDASRPQPTMMGRIVIEATPQQGQGAVYTLGKPQIG